MLPPSINLPSQIPVMVLSGCNLLPHGLLPLYIFEPRYRQMLADALESDRIFAIGTVDPNTDLTAENPAILPFSCAGMIRACVAAEDGTSHLVLQGLQRIDFVSWEPSEKPYRIANIAPIPTINENAAATTTLANRARELARDFIATGYPAPSPKALEEIESIDDPEPLADLIAYHLIRNPYRRHALLGISEIGERFRFLISELATSGTSLP